MEKHLLAYNIQLDNGTLQKAVFIFSDNGLCYVEVRGNAASLAADKKDDPMIFMDYQVYPSNWLFINTQQDAAWILAAESLHPNLFAWDNPLLADPNSTISYEPSAKVPDYIQIGGNFESMRKKLEAEAKFIMIDTLDGSDPNAQFQINAYGVPYAGFPRKFEARFGDDQLNMIWILTGKGEEDRIRQKLIDAYGDPVYVSNDWEFFNNWAVGLRKDKPEVLLLTKKLAKRYKSSFDQ